MEWVPINFSLLKNPLNWFIVVFMIFLLQIPLVLLHDKIMPHIGGDTPPPS